jgi:outer membrane protein OmpA-like peptidoglycan-associated protein
MIDQYPRSRSAVAVCVLLAITASLLFPTASPAEEKEASLRPTGLRGLIGAALPDDAKASLLLGATFNLGTVWKPWLQLSTGVSRWSSDLDRALPGTTKKGSISDVRVHTNIGVESGEISGVRAFLDTGVALHFLTADIPAVAGPAASSLESALDGTNAGAEVGAGLMSTRGKVQISVEGRREFVDDGSNWSVALGIGTRWDRPKKPKAPDSETRLKLIVPPPDQVATPPSASAPTETAATPPPQPAVLPAPAPSYSDERLRALEAENRALRMRLDELAYESQRQREQATAAEIAALRAQQEEIKRSLEAMRLSSVESARLEETRNGFLLSLRSSVLFAGGSSALQPGARDEIRRLSDVLRRFPGATIIVEGHTDDEGDRGQNLRLSQERAEAVKQELTLSNLWGMSIEAVGYGADRPIGDNRTPAGRAQNRRVEIRVLPKPATGE